MLVKDNGDGTARSYSRREWQKDNPNTMARRVMTEALWASYGVYKAAVDPEPDHDPLTERVEKSIVSDGAGGWRVAKTVASKSQAEINERRNGQVAERPAFALAAMDAGLITEAEAEAWASGEKVQRIDSAFTSAGLTGRDLVRARVEARSSQMIRRASAFIPILQAHLVRADTNATGITDAEVDALFAAAGA